MGFRNPVGCWSIITMVTNLKELANKFDLSIRMNQFLIII